MLKEYDPEHEPISHISFHTMKDRYDDRITIPVDQLPEEVRLYLQEIYTDLRAPSRQKYLEAEEALKTYFKEKWIIWRPSTEVPEDGHWLDGARVDGVRYEGRMVLGNCPECFRGGPLNATCGNHLHGKYVSIHAYNGTGIYNPILIAKMFCQPIAITPDTFHHVPERAPIPHTDPHRDLYRFTILGAQLEELERRYPDLPPNALYLVDRALGHEGRRDRAHYAQHDNPE